ncbi:MAG: EMC3/TMCO1 family protein [Candidatus Micrarchaeia archaeon]|jgi:uncharacterized membrane protein (DUF106 family)
MDFTIYAVFVTIMAVIYAFMTREIQYRFGNRKESEEFQKKSKELNDQMKEASKRKDQKKVEELMKKQTELLPEMNKIMMGQFKMMIPVLILFFALTWVVNNFDQTTKDDVIVTLIDNGIGCDKLAKDYIFSACYLPESKNYGAWAVEVKAFGETNNSVGENSTYFIYGIGDEEPYFKGQKGEPVSVSLSKTKYTAGEEIAIYAKSDKAVSMTAYLDNGTRFYVDLPFAIPILNVKRINEAYWWFIFVSILAGLAISFIMGKIRNVPGGKNITPVAK